jgi:hypothetical protein
MFVHSRCDRVDRIGGPKIRESGLATSQHPAAPHHLPAFITAPGETDVLMIVTAAILVLAVLGVGILFLRLHTLPERIAHKTHKLQFEIVAVLGLLALFTHMHIFWVAGLLLALVDLPDFGTPLRRIATGVEKIAGIPPEETAADATAGTHPIDGTDALPDSHVVEEPGRIRVARHEEAAHA